ncbi:MAG: CoA transferase [Chloroflexi bacterium]|nr:CoA transferase [Chloroflexota bacterium]
MGLPLEGIRVVEMGQLLAVPYLCKILADMGAEIFRFESCTRLDPHRTTVFYDNEADETFYNKAANFHDQNRNKLGFTLDLGTKGGQRMFRDLIRISDIFCENFTPRVMANFKMEYKDLRQIRPDIIMLSSTGYGYDGPWGNYGAVGPTVEASSGLMHVSGYPEGAPVLAEIPFTDFVGAEHGLFAVMAALHYRAQTGKGQFIDLSQQASQVAIAPEPVLDYLANGREALSGGSTDHPYMAPYGVFPCRTEPQTTGKGEVDRWIAIAVGTDAQWQSLLRVMGDEQAAADPTFADAVSRRRHRKELNQRLAEWTGRQEAFDLMKRLQAEGVPAGVAITNRDMLFNPHLQERGFFRVIRHPEGSGLPSVLPYPGTPWVLHGAPPLPAQPGAYLGEHNRRVIVDILGWPEGEMKSLEEEGAIGYAPVSFPRPKPVGLDVMLRQARIAGYDTDFKERVAREFEGKAQSK